MALRKGGAPFRHAPETRAAVRDAKIEINHRTSHLGDDSKSL
jgi:hypothetical protein